AARASLSPAEDRVATFFAQHREEVMFLSAVEIAARLDMSDATVIRAAQSLGYTGLPALKAELREALRTRATPPLRLGRRLEDLGDDPAAVLEHVLATELQLLHDARETLRATDFARALELMAGAQRVVVQGLGPNAPLAEYFAARLRRMRRSALSVGARGQALADVLIDMRRGDVVVVLAYDRSSPEAELTLERARELALPSLLITDTLGLALAGQFTVALSARRAVRPAGPRLSRLRRGHRRAEPRASASRGHRSGARAARAIRARVGAGRDLRAVRAARSGARPDLPEERGHRGRDEERLREQW